MSSRSTLLELRSLYYLAITRAGPFALIIFADREIESRSPGPVTDTLQQLVKDIINVTVGAVGLHKLLSDAMSSENCQCLNSIKILQRIYDAVTSSQNNEEKSHLFRFRNTFLNSYRVSVTFIS